MATQMDLDNLYARIDEAQGRMLSAAKALLDKAKAEPLDSPARIEYLAHALGLTEARRLLDKTCFVADADGSVAPLPSFPRDWPIIDTEHNDSSDADWRDAQRTQEA